jgi:outer membrane protein assembly factor BamB
VWTHGALLLVLANTHHDRNAKTEHVLFAFDFATGAPRWTLPIARAHSAPMAVGDTLVMTSQGDVVELDQVLLVDAKTGAARTAGARLDTYDMPVVANDDIWMSCEHWDRFCQTLVDTERAATPQDWLARVDIASATPRAVTLPDGTPQPLGGAGHATWLARYQDSVLVVESTTNQQLTRTRLGERTARWTYRPRGAFDSTSYFSNYAAQAPDAAYLRNVPGRYLPLFVTNDEGSRIVILDLDTGTASWESQPFTPDDNQAFIVRGLRYYAVLPVAGNALLAINANTGKLDGVYQIAVGDDVDAPVVTNLNDLPNPWHFQGGMLVGHWRRAHYWMIDLNASKLQIASPGVKLLTPWNDVERVLGPVPRAITL